MRRHQCRAQVGDGEIGGVKVLLAKPRTFVNASGEVVACLLRKHNIPINDLIVIYDDLDLPFGRLRLRAGGSAGGHKGMKSVISALGSQDFCRVKVGIGRPTTEDGTPVTDEDTIVSYVLGDFTPEEEEVIKGAITRVGEAIYALVKEGITVAMNKFN